MKNISKLMLLSSLMLLTFWSCEKDQVIDYYEGGTPPALTSSTNTLDLSYADADKIALSLNWTNPNYVFTTGISSQDVSYLIEIDTAGANFTNPQKQSVAVSESLSKSFLVAEFNDFLLNQLVLTPGVSHNLEIRVTASLGNSAAVPLESNVLAITATPYAIPPKVEPPASGTLYVTGSATNGNWMGGGDPPLPSQQFTQLSPTLYEISVYLIGGGSYTFVPVYGDWGIKYSIKVKNDPTEVNGGDFQKGGEDILAPAISGTYKIQVDFQRGKFTVSQ